MKIRNFVLGAIALTSIGGSISGVAAQSQAEGSRSFTLGNYQLRARQQQNSGLMTGVTLYRISDYESPEGTVIIYAKFARQDPRNSKRWILGGVEMYQIGGKNRVQSKVTATQYIFHVGQ